MKHFRTNRALTLGEIQKFAPAALADKAGADVSKNYSFLSTKKVIDTLERKNIVPYSVTQTSARSEYTKETAKHMLRFRQKNFKVSLGELIPEIVLETSHDAKSAFRFSLGIYRLICSNGLVAPHSIFKTISIRHMKATDADVIDAAFEVLEKCDDVVTNISNMKQINLSQEQKYNFAKNAFELRWKAAEAPQISPINLLEPRRYEEKGNNLWNTFNVIQENLVRGGIGFYKLDHAQSPIKWQRTREVNSISKNLELNKNLWELANHYLFLKS